MHYLTPARGLTRSTEYTTDSHLKIKPNRKVIFLDPDGIRYWDVFHLPSMRVPYHFMHQDRRR